MVNIALARAAHHYRAQGHTFTLRRAGNARAVEPHLDDPKWDLVIASTIFERTRPLAERVRTIYPGAVIGGTGWRVESSLTELGIEDGPLDYSDWKQTYSIGYAMRGCRLKCKFCVVPRKEGKARTASTIAEIWRGDPWPRHVMLLDNDVFGSPKWPDVIGALIAGRFRVCYCQGINARFLNDETAAAIASTDYRDRNFRERRMITAWDGRNDEERLFRGLELLVKHGIKPDNIEVYMLVGHEPGETHADRDYRRARLREFGCRPYPMPFSRDDHEVCWFQGWVIGAYDKSISWEDWKRAKGNPRRLTLRTRRRVSLPLFFDMGPITPALEVL
jgi:hypothetical protein